MTDSRYIVTVTFKVARDRAGAFSSAVLLQAKNSLELESGCKLFDVAVDPDDECVFFLYEIYTDEDAFTAHLESEHFMAFDHLVGPWTVSKKVRIFERLSSG